MVEQINEKIFMNPGSVTGAYSNFVQESIPSFMLTAIKNDEVTVFIYELTEGSVNVNKVQFSK